MKESNAITIYDRIGGEAALKQLVVSFYAKVQKQPLIAPLFPENIEPVSDKQFLFLSQFFGGPSLYSDLYGHPMMRARHMPFPITSEHADAWLKCMSEALAEINIDEFLQAAILERLKGTAYHFINTPNGKDVTLG
ncbi:globin [Paenibacillus psychroresistens]|uniref:Globin n=1 Tax=Paenibacillus psychroresistens TaxID=1778678 RepID=A0A6B8RGW9_9BACL|nr:globin [Paenibacillus psychroresistens]QGQ94782.1 globin [Paenibacillus psychroresistens]